MNNPSGTNYLPRITFPNVRGSGTQLVQFPIVSGYVLEITSSTLSVIFQKRSSEDFFTVKEMREIEKSLIDIQKGNYKSFKNTDELFAELDSE